MCAVSLLLPGVMGGKHERRLLGDLLLNYNPLERPVENETDPVQVSFGITLQQIIDVVRSSAAPLNTIKRYNNSVHIYVYCVYTYIVYIYIYIYMYAFASIIALR